MWGGDLCVCVGVLCFGWVCVCGVGGRVCVFLLVGVCGVCGGCFLLVCYVGCLVCVCSVLCVCVVSFVCV